MQKNLTQMRQGEKGVVHNIVGGAGFLKRLESLGVRPGVSVTKVSSQLMHGPVTIRVGNSQIALGFGMSRKIIVRNEKA